MLRIFCVWPPCRLEREGRKEVSGGLWEQGKGHPPLPQVLKANPGATLDCRSCEQGSVWTGSAPESGKRARGCGLGMEVRREESPLVTGEDGKVAESPVS